MEISLVKIPMDQPIIILAPLTGRQLEVYFPLFVLDLIGRNALIYVLVFNLVLPAHPVKLF